MNQENTQGGAMTKFSILDLAPIKEGGDAKQALNESVEISQCAESWG